MAKGAERKYKSRSPGLWRAV